MHVYVVGITLTDLLFVAEGGSLDSVQRVMVSFRLLRKRALHSTILKLQDALGTTSKLAAKPVASDSDA